MDTVIKTPRQDKKNSPVKGRSLSPVFPPTPLETSVCHMLGVLGMGLNKLTLFFLRDICDQP